LDQKSEREREYLGPMLLSAEEYHQSPTFLYKRILFWIFLLETSEKGKINNFHLDMTRYGKWSNTVMSAWMWKNEEV
jgi:hypothetical protein